MRDSSQVLNEMVAAGVIKSYAIGGAIAASFYIEASETEDIDVFVLYAALSNKRVFEAKERRRLEKAGYSPKKKMAIVKKLRDNSRRLKASKLLKKSRVISD